MAGEDCRYEPGVYAAADAWEWDALCWDTLCWDTETYPENGYVLERQVCPGAPSGEA